MTEISIAGAILNPSLVLPTGKAALPIKAGQAKAGEHYGSLKKKDVEEPLLDNVVAKPAGEDAKPVDAEGTRLTLESAVIQAPVAGNAAGNEAGNEAATEAAMPGQLAQGYPPSAQGAAGAALSEANSLGGQVFAYAGADAGAGADALLLAQADTSIKSDVVASEPAGVSEILCVRRGETFSRRLKMFTTYRQTQWKSQFLSYTIPFVNRSS